MFVRNKRAAPDASPTSPNAMPNPAVQSGGTSAAAIATPARAAGISRLAIAYAPAAPDASATAISSNEGSPRASISVVVTCSGITSPPATATRSPISTPVNVVTTAVRIKRKLPTSSPTDNDIKGDIKGATNMAPMMTAALFCSKPNAASNDDTNIRNVKLMPGPLNSFA